MAFFRLVRAFSKKKYIYASHTTSIFNEKRLQTTLYQLLCVILVFIIVFVINSQQKYDNQLQLPPKLIHLIIQITNHHTKYQTTICQYINYCKFTIKSINYPINSKSTYTRTSPIGAPTNSNRTIKHEN